MPIEDNTLIVVKPFQEAGYVSIVELWGRGQQPVAYKHCTNTIRTKVCHYPGYGPIAGNGSENLQNCKEGEDIDIYNGKDRIVWLSGFDSDEFALSTDGACLVNELEKFGDVNGLMIPWFCVGHSQHFLSPRNKLVTETYTQRMTGAGGLDKAFMRFYFIDHLSNSHVGTFKNRKPAVDENFQLMDYHRNGKYPARQFYDNAKEIENRINSTYPKYRLYHYMTKSVEHLVKKWSRGQADHIDEWGRSAKRPLVQIVEWLKGFATEWIKNDETVLPMAKIVNDVLNGPKKSSTTGGYTLE